MTKFVSIAQFISHNVNGDPTRIVNAISDLYHMIADGFAFPSVNGYNVAGVVVAEPMRKLTDEDLKAIRHESLPAGEVGPDLAIQRLSRGFESCQSPEDVSLMIASLADQLVDGCAAALIDPAYGGACIVSHLGGSKKRLNKGEVAAIRSRQILVDMPVEGEVRQ